MSVDTYLKGKTLTRYRSVEQDGVKILVASSLLKWAANVHLDTKQFLIWKSFNVAVEHKHAPT